MINDVVLDKTSDALLTSFINDGYIFIRKSIFTNDPSFVIEKEVEEERLIKGMDSNATIFVDTYAKDNKNLLIIENKGEQKGIHIEFAQIFRLIMFNGKQKSEIIKSGTLEFNKEGAAVLLSE